MHSLEDVSNTPLPRLAERRPASHKGDFGRALLIGGSRGMSGAIALAGTATLRSGAGLVTLAVPGSVQNVVATIEPSYMTQELPEEVGQIAVLAADTILEMSKPATALALGPGLGRSPTLTALVAKLYSEIRKPMVVDADALFALAEHRDVLSNPGGLRVLTPHPGEFARLTGLSTGEVQADRQSLARQWAARWQVVLVLKGHRSVITDGRRSTLNTTGNAGMATGGTGDVLTGIITALLGQGLSPLDAARLGAHLHGLAGDLAAAELGEVSLIASDLPHYLPQAFQHCLKESG